MSDLEDEDDETCWNDLESFRVTLITVIDPSRITPYLRQCRVINHDDEEQILNDPSLVLRKRKTGLLLDILQRTGKKGFVAFLESLELYYPHLYKKITGNNPTRVFSMIIDTAGESSLMELLMSEVSKLQGAIREERQKVQELNMALCTKEDTIKEMRVRDSVLRNYQERTHKMKEERDALSRELKLCRDENYELAMNYAKQSEEKNTVLMKNRDLQLELVGEKELLELRCTSLQNDNQIYQDRIKAILKQLEEVAAERDQALLTQERCHKQYSQSLRDKDSYRKQIRELGERCDELQLQLFQKEGQLLSAEAKLKRLCLDPSTLTSDLEENSSRSSQELTPHENPDEDGKASSKAKEHSSIQDPQFGVLENNHLLPTSQEGDLSEKGRRRMKDSFEHYRRKRALRRAQKSRYHEVDWEHSSGSDNTDTEGS